MAANPFGAHPTLGQYLAWAAHAGCTVKYGYRTASDGRALRLVMVDSFHGNGWVHIVEMLDTEYLLPTMIAHFDRRLGIQSPFFSIDPDVPAASY